MFKKPLALIVMPLVFVGCSGSSGGGGSTASSTGFGSTIQAQFIDAPVKGLVFTNQAGTNSQTGDEGKFTCSRGEKITFSLGGLNLGYGACGEKIFIHDLSSNATNYSWQQAAAVIQSFSVANGGALDLSGVNHTSLNLSAMTYNAVAATFETAIGTARTANSAHIPAGSAAVTVSNATTAANASVSTYIQLDETLRTYLTEIATYGDGTFKLDGTLASGTSVEGEEWCWTKIRALAEVESASGAFYFNINSAVSYDEDSVLDGDACDVSAEADDECETEATARLPKRKLITGFQFDQIFNNSYLNDSEVNGNLEVTNNLSLTSAINAAEEGIDLSGTFQSIYNVTSGPLTGTTVTCRYNVTSSWK